jgi:pyruvate dehydrogenase E1 component
MLPVYIYYSMFGFQRVGDLIWAAADQRARGFLVGATSGRTTLAGEGLQHQDGSSHLIAATIPNCLAYDPATAYELAVLFDEGSRRMLESHQDVFYYLTVTNENSAQPSMPEGSKEGILRGMYRFRSAPAGQQAQVRILAAGPILREALLAADLLQEKCSVAAEVWSVTSFSELARDGQHAARRGWIHGESVTPWVTSQLGNSGLPVIAVSDYVRAVPEMIRAYVPGPYQTLGTDGFGRSDTRVALRDFFQISAPWIAYTALVQMIPMKDRTAQRLAAAADVCGVDLSQARDPLAC